MKMCLEWNKRVKHLSEFNDFLLPVVLAIYLS